MNPTERFKMFEEDNKHDWALADWNVTPVGSQITCNPKPVGTDIDYLILTDKSIAIPHLKKEGFIEEGLPDFYTGNDNGGFVSMRKGLTNVILTSDIEFYNKFLQATELAKKFNLIHKKDRISLFQVILYDVKVENL